MNTTYIVGVIAGIFTSMSLLPQLIKMIREKHAGDISITMFVVLLTGLGLWVSYGLLREDWPIIITNSVSFSMNLAILILSLVYKRKRSMS